MTFESLFGDLLVVVVGGAIGAYVAMRNNRSSTPAPPVPRIRASEHRAPPTSGRASCPPPRVNHYGELDEP